MSVKAPAEKNFRRAKVRPGGKKGSGAGVARWLSWRVGRWSVAVVRRALRRLSRHQPRAAGVRAAGPPHHRARQRAAVERRGAGDRRRAARREHPDRRSRPATGSRLLESPWVADVALRRVLPSTVEVFVSRAAADGASAGSARTLYLVDRARHDHRRVRPAVRRVRPADHRRPGRRAERRPAVDRRGARRAGGAGDRRAGGRKPTSRSGSRRSTCATRTTRSCCSRTTRRCCTSARTSSSSGCSRTGPGAGAARARAGHRLRGPAVRRARVRAARRR